MDYNTNDFWMTFWTAFGAIATTLAVILALFLDKIKSFLFKPNIIIKSINFTKDLNYPHITNDFNHSLLYFHLKIINKSYFKITNFQLRIIGVTTYKLQDNEYIEDIKKKLDIPIPINLNPIDIIKYEILTLFFILENSRTIKFEVPVYTFFIDLIKWSYGFDWYLESIADNHYETNKYLVKIRFKHPIFIRNNNENEINLEVELIDI